MRFALTFSGCHRRGGIERVMLECANYLDTRGHDVHVFSTIWDQNVINPGVHRHHVDVRPGPSLWHIPRFAMRSRRDLRRLDPPAQALGAFGVMSPPGGVMWIQSVHRAWIQISAKNRNFKGRLKQKCNLFHPMILAMERYYLAGRRYKKLIALTEEVKADLMLHYGVPADDIVVIPNGFSPTEFSVRRAKELRESMRQSLGFAPGDKVIVFVANELDRKGFGPLLRAIARLNRPETRLLVVGRASPDAYRAEIAQLGMADRVKFSGPSSDVARQYAAADVFALPTQYEAWGLVIVEAMACGLPALTSRLAGAAVTIIPGRNGELLDDPADVDEIAAKLGPLLDGRHESGEWIGQSVSDYAWERLLGRYEELLIEAAGVKQTIVNV